MSDAIAAATLSCMSAQLDNEELGAAVRILLRLQAERTSLRRRNLHIIAGVSKGQWAEMSENVLEHFQCTDTSVSHSSLDSAPLAAAPAKARSGEAGSLPVYVSRSVQQVEVPSYQKGGRPQVKSMKSAAFENGVEILTARGRPPAVARRIIASLFRDHPEADVIAAISKAKGNPDIQDPHSWIVACLRNTNKTRYGKQIDAQPRQIVSPALAGISNERAAQIRKRNEALRKKAYASQGEE